MIYCQLFRPFVTKSLSVTMTARGNTGLIAHIFEKIDISKVNSRYTSAMIEEKDENFVQFLSNILENEIVEDWFYHPNCPSTLEMITDNGYEFYNHFYIGNEGYEWIEECI